jgi:hypothetical protein
MAVNLELLTDDAILDYTRLDGKDHVLFDIRDINFKEKIGMGVYPNGVYDTSIFGSIFQDSCCCRHLKIKNGKSTDVCPNCGTRALTYEDGLRRFARIELPFYYLNDLRFEVFYNFFNEIFDKADVKIEYDFVSDNAINSGYTQLRSSKRLSIKAFDSCQFNYDPNKKKLVISEVITDESKCSYEGILGIISKHFPESLTEYKKYINRYFIVMPAVMRNITPVRTKDGVTGKVDIKWHIPPLSVYYRNVIAFCCREAVETNPVNYDSVMNSLKTPGERVRYTALLRAFLNATKTQSTELLNSSKENLAREIYGIRTQNSGRCPIVPSVEMAIDELGIPTQIAYEMCREGFIKYLMNELNFSEKEANIATKEEALNPETQKLFKEYAESRYVLEN